MHFIHHHRLRAHQEGSSGSDIRFMSCSITYYIPGTESFFIQTAEHLHGFSRISLITLFPLNISNNYYPSCLWVIKLVRTMSIVFGVSKHDRLVRLFLHFTLNLLHICDVRNTYKLRERNNGIESISMEN